MNGVEIPHEESPTRGRRQTARAQPPRRHAGRLPAPAAVDDLVMLLKAIGHPLRFRIVALLCEGDRHVGAIARRLTASRPVVSQHLRLLRAQRIVTATRADGFVRYRLGSAAARALVRSARGWSGPPAARAADAGRAS
jgi:DNA-binding transcriptional ArsR family regulator